MKDIIEYSAYKRAMQEMQYLYDNYGNLEVHERGLTIHSRSGSGKTTLLKKFVEKYPAKITPTGRLLPVIYVSISTPSVTSLLTEILGALGMPGFSATHDRMIYMIRKQLSVVYNC